MPNSNQRPKITVEDLLRLKRAERPAAEFWDKFERELRQKQLTALLEKRPWWQELPQLLGRRAYLPVGATAILAFTLVSVKYYVPMQVAQADSTAAAGHALTVDNSSLLAAATAPVPVSSVLVNRSVQPLASANEQTPVVATAAEVSVPPTAELLPTLVAPAADPTPSARTIAANLARLEKSEPELVNSVLGSRLSPPARVQSASTELASVPADSSKRNRILAQYSDRPLSPEPTAPAIVRERLSRRLGDSEITDRLSRIGLKGDQVSLGLTFRL